MSRGWSAEKAVVNAPPDTTGVSEGSVRGSKRRIERGDQPTTFWVAVTIYYTLAGLMLVGAIALWSGWA